MSSMVVERRPGLAMTRAAAPSTTDERLRVAKVWFGEFLICTHVFSV